MPLRLIAIATCTAASLALVPAPASAQFGSLTKWGGVGQLAGPQDIAVDSAGNVYVADTGNDRVRKYDSNGTFATQWNNSGAAASIVVDPSGNVITGNGDDSLLRRFTPTGGLIGTIGAQGSAGGEISNPKGVATDAAGDIYVADANNIRVQKFDAAGNFLRTWGRNVFNGGGAGAEICTVPASCQAGLAGGGNGEFGDPQGVAIDASSQVYVVDAQSNRVQVFDSDGNYLRQMGSAGSGDGQLDMPQGVAISPSGTLWVADSDNNRIQEFTPAGGFVRAVGWDVDMAGGNQFEICTASCQPGLFGSGDGQFDRPRGIATDCKGNVYVSNFGGALVQKLGDPASGSPPCTQTPAPPPAGQADKTVKIVLSRKRRQRALRRGIVVRVGCGAEACTALVEGSLIVPGTSAAKRFKLRRVTRSVAANKLVRVKLKLTKKSKRALRRSLAKRKKPRVRIKVTVTDAARNRASESTTVRVRR